jgi:hypothetical protein
MNVRLSTACGVTGSIVTSRPVHRRELETRTSVSLPQRDPQLLDRCCLSFCEGYKG